MESRLHLDKETEIPLSLIDIAPWNSKTPIHGQYRRGLIGSLETFGVRDRLKVWPDPLHKGRYICLNGNQRIDVIKEDLIRQCARERFGAPEGEISETSLTKMMNDPNNSSIVQEITQSILTYKVPCQIITKLDADTKLDKADAKLLTLSFDRNQAKPDEIKVAEEYRNILTEKAKASTEANRDLLARKLKALIRPELPTIEPAKKVVPSPDQTSFQFAEPGNFTPTEAEPWGPSPPNPLPSSISNGQSAQAFVPMVFSFTAEGYKQINENILRSKSRVFREQKLLTALERLATISMERHEDPSELDDRITSIVVEVALRTTNEHIKQLEQV